MSLERSLKIAIVCGASAVVRDEAQADLSFRLSGAAISLRSSEIAHQNCSHIENSNFLLLRSLLIVRLACLDFLHRLVHELNGFFAMSSLVWGGFVQLCSGLLQVSIGCAHVRLMTRHLLALGVTSQRIQAQSEKQDCPAAGCNNFLNHRELLVGFKDSRIRRVYFVIGCLNYLDDTQPF